MSKKLKLNTPRAESVYRLCGGSYQEHFFCNRDQLRKLKEFYGTEVDESPLLDAMNERDLFRKASRDGFRMLTMMADLNLLEPGRDPIKSLLQIAMEAGVDVDSQDGEWAEEEEVDADDDVAT